MADGTLLQQMLGLLSGGGLHTIDEAARRLGVSVALVEAMADNLVRRGYLVAVQGSCSLSCSGCGEAEACGISAHSSSPSRLMALTAKGRLAAQGT